MFFQSLIFYCNHSKYDKDLVFCIISPWSPTALSFESFCVGRSLLLYLHWTFRTTEADGAASCPRTAQWYLPASSLLAWKTVFFTGRPSLNQTSNPGVGQPDTQLRLTSPPSVTVLGCTTAANSEAKEEAQCWKNWKHLTRENIDLFFVVTFYRQSSWSFTTPCFEYCHKTKKVIPLVMDSYILDLQATVALVVAHICKVVRAVKQGEQSPPVRFPLAFWPADRNDIVKQRIGILALHHDGCPFQSALAFIGYAPVATPDTFGPKYI